MIHDSLMISMNHFCTELLFAQPIAPATILYLADIFVSATTNINIFKNIKIDRMFLDTCKISPTVFTFVNQITTSCKSRHLDTHNIRTRTMWSALCLLVLLYIYCTVELSCLPYHEIHDQSDNISLRP